MRVDGLLPACLGVLLAFGVACERNESAERPAAPSASASSQRAPQRYERLLEAEHRRDSRAVDAKDLSSREPGVRRAAARTLARIADARAVEKLLGLLRDEDPEVVTWSAYGLGYACRGRETKLVRALVVRAASWIVVEQPTPKSTEVEPPLFAIAQALARCGGTEAERSLRAWLSEPTLSEAAALALGNLAGIQERLEDASMVALLDAASSPKPPNPQALYAFSRLVALSSTVQDRLVEVASEALSSNGLARSFAVRALGSAGEGAAPVLERAALDEAYDPSDRAAASRSLRRLGEPGKAALERVLAGLVARGVDSKRLESATFGILLTTLEGLEVPVSAARQPLNQLAELPVPDTAGPARRRVVTLRCGAAALLAGRASAARRLLECDPDEQGVTGQLARLSALGRGPLTGARLRSWQRFVASKSPVVRQAALGLLGTHAEVKESARLLAEALKASEPGTVATAAQIIAAYPDRASTLADSHAPDAELVKVLQGKLDAKAPSAPIEVMSALMDAAGSLQLLGAKAALEHLCRSDQPTLRRHAETALQRLGDKKRQCDEFAPPKQAPAEVARAAKLVGPSELVLQTDIGDLSVKLDPELAPVAVERIIELVKAGYYDQMVVHRVVPGFVAQFGDTAGDGYGDGGKPPIRCETSPRAFQALDVGMALAGRDTASSQLFITLGRYPRLDGNYAWVGRAAGDWGRLAQGDRILKVKAVQR